MQALPGIAPRLGRTGPATYDGPVTQVSTGTPTEARHNVAPDGRRLLRLEVRNAETPIERKPEWIKTRA